MIIWLTGLSSAGKSTIARALALALQSEGHDTELLDGDEVREALGNTLSYSRSDRDENIRRIGYIANLLAKHGIITIVAAISPYRDARDAVRARTSRFIEVFVNAPIATCEARDVKGLYRRARSGEIAQFTGVSDPYESPLHPEVECHTESERVEDSVEKIIAYVRRISQLNKQNA